MITKFEDFKNEAAIPNLNGLGTSGDPIATMTENKIEALANKYELKFLKQFYCEEDDPKATAQALIDYSNLDESAKTDEDKNALILLLRAPIAYYIAWNYLNDATIFNNTIGGTITNSPNGVRQNNIQRCVKIWNEMVDMISEVYETEYDTEYMPDEDIFYNVNSFNI